MLAQQWQTPVSAIFLPASILVLEKNTAFLLCFVPALWRRVKKVHIYITACVFVWNITQNSDRLQSEGDGFG